MYQRQRDGRVRALKDRVFRMITFELLNVWSNSLQGKEKKFSMKKKFSINSSNMFQLNIFLKGGEISTSSFHILAGEDVKKISNLALFSLPQIYHEL